MFSMTSRFCIKKVCPLMAFLTISFLSITACNKPQAEPKKQLIRIAKIEIDSAQLDDYNALLKEGIETAMRVEPGVLSLQAVADKHHPTHITVFEIYADTNAYKTHIETPHFKKYKTAVKPMVKSLELVDVTAVAIGTK